MRIRNRHERIVTAPPERIAALIADADDDHGCQFDFTVRSDGASITD